MGRNAFCNFLLDHEYVVKRRKTRKTTNSRHHFHKHSNLIRNFIPTAPNQLRLSYITYISKEGSVCYHSDRGVQYCCHKYVDTLIENHILISMTENGDPLENAIAECINGILKTELLYQMTLKDQEHANREINRIINFYNKQRPHLSINMLTPDQAHKMNGHIKQRSKKRQSTEAVF